MHEPAWPDARLAAHGLGARAVTPAESVPLDRSWGRTLAERLVALTPLPGFDTSAMDGWAIRGLGPWVVVGSSVAGSSYAGEIRDGEGVGIATGARIPPGATAIIRQEHATLDGELLESREAVNDRDIRPQGEECREGDVLAVEGSYVTPGLAGLAAAVGYDAVEVRTPPRVEMIVFGDELVAEGRPELDRVRDSLGPQVPAWLALMGAGEVTVRHGRDTLDAHVEALAAAAAVSDLIVTTGGTATGPLDHVRAAIARLGGAIEIDTVAVRPGHPMLLGTLDHAGRGVPVLGLPGNPQSAIVALASLGLPLFAGLLGRPLPRLGRVRLRNALTAPPGEHRLVAGKRDAEGGFTAASRIGSAMLVGLASATGFAVVPPGGAAASAVVSWQPLPLPANLGDE